MRTARHRLTAPISIFALQISRGSACPRRPMIRFDSRALLPQNRLMRPEKHSLTLHGHRTSVSLEPAFWQAFRDLAQRNALGLNELAAQIDAIRPAGCVP